MTELLGIIRHLDLEFLSHSYDRFRILYRRTVTVWLHRLDTQSADTLILKLKHGSDRLLEPRLAHINNRFLCNQFLRRRWQYGKHQQGCYYRFSVHIHSVIVKVSDLAVARYSGA